MFSVKSKNSKNVTDVGSAPMLRRAVLAASNQGYRPVQGFLVTRTIIDSIRFGKTKTKIKLYRKTKTK